MMFTNEEILKRLESEISAVIKTELAKFNADIDYDGPIREPQCSGVAIEVPIEKILKERLGPDRYALWLQATAKEPERTEALRTHNDELQRQVNLKAALEGLGFGDDLAPHTMAIKDLFRLQTFGKGKSFLVEIAEDGHVAQSFEIRKAAPPTVASPKLPWYRRLFARKNR